MSDAKPFATMSHEGAGPYLWMEDIQFQAYAPDGNPFKAMDKINAAVASLVAAARKEERDALEARLSLAEKVVEAAGKEPWIMRGQPGDDFEYGCEGCCYRIEEGRVVHGRDCAFAEIRAALAAYRSAR